MLVGLPLARASRPRAAAAIMVADGWKAPIIPDAMTSASEKVGEASRLGRRMVLPAKMLVDLRALLPDLLEAEEGVSSSNACI